MKIPIKKNNQNENKKITLLNQGTYGCVFHPGIKCSGKKEEAKYVSKIQRSDITIDNEISIGEKIIKIKDYSLYFAPIIKSCPLELSKVQIENDELQKCEVITKDTTSNFVVNKIRYISNKNLRERFTEIKDAVLGQPNKPIIKLLKTMVKDHLYVLEGLRLLSEKGIVHYDLKDNNVLYDIDRKIPIIIDFGLSIDMSKLNRNNYKMAFYDFNFDYPYWCIDITILSYIVKELGELWDQQKVDMNKINEILQTQIVKLQFFTEILTQEERNKWLLDYKTYYSKFENKYYVDILNELLTFYKSWDNYSMAAIILIYIYSNNLSSDSTFVPYIQLLKDIVLRIPPERPTSENTIKTIKQTLKFNREQNPFLRTSIARKENVQPPQQNQQPEPQPQQPQPQPQLQ